ncbi:MAG TPA: hypothetical protein VFT99_16600, partial [Roseiflexaceae bacterium]|nr:hypothetical protein [Roseiflexaceae bacterium]
MPAIHRELATQLATLFGPLPQVEAVAVAGSLGSGPGASDSASDIDLYVYTRSAIPLDTRLSIAEQTGGFGRSNFDVNYWGSGDLWVHAPTGIELDVMYFEAQWMENQIAEVVEHYQPRMGYTTCFWYTVRQSL